VCAACDTDFRGKSGIKRKKTRKGGNDSDGLPLKAARHDSIWVFKSELQTNPMPYHLELLWGTTLMPHRGCAMDWDRTKQ